MSGAVEKIVEKISAYELINNLIPGAVYISVIEQVTSFQITFDNLLAQIVLYYFAGVVISRIGSLCIEEPLRKWRYGIETVPHDEFTKAELKDKDGKIATLSATNNMYRAFVSVSVCILLTVLADMAWRFWIPKEDWVKSVIIVLGCILLTVIFAKSYRKQTGYVVSRVKTILEEEQSGSTEQQ